VKKARQDELIPPSFLASTTSAAPLTGAASGVTKNAAVALAEHLAIQYGDRGIRVSVLCPQSVQTGMTTPGPSAARIDGVLQPMEVARMVVEAMDEERFLILTHPQVQDYMRRKASDRDRWLSGMQRLRDKDLWLEGRRLIRRRAHRCACSTPRTRRGCRPSPRGHCARNAPVREKNDRRLRPDAASLSRRARRRPA
jgi:hypothetical protein